MSLVTERWGNRAAKKPEKVDREPMPKKPADVDCDLCNGNGTIPFVYVLPEPIIGPNGKQRPRISELVAACRCKAGEWWASREQRTGRQFKRYFELPRDFRPVDPTSFTEISQFNRKRYEELREVAPPLGATMENTWKKPPRKPNAKLAEKVITNILAKEAPPKRAEDDEPDLPF